MYGSSRLGRRLPSAVNATATGFTTRFGTETYQIRVKSGQAVWAVILNSTTLTTSVIAGTSTSSDTQVLATYLPANEWDYWTVTPGQFLCWRSTSTSTNAWISVTEIS